jgi:hypothetical protein
VAGDPRLREAAEVGEVEGGGGSAEQIRGGTPARSQHDGDVVLGRSGQFGKAGGRSLGIRHAVIVAELTPERERTAVGTCGPAAVVVTDAHWMVEAAADQLAGDDIRGESLSVHLAVAQQHRMRGA